MKQQRGSNETMGGIDPARQRASRRDFLAGAVSTGVALLRPADIQGAKSSPMRPDGSPDIPPLDLHVHLDNSSIDTALELSRARGVKFGIVEHAGTRENVYPVILSNDAELGQYLEMLAAKPVYRGVQAEWTDWMGCFSPEMLARLDYVLTDAMTFPGRDGQRVKLWTKEAKSKVDMADQQAFMERYVDWHVQIMEKLPIDILANVSWLPKDLADDYEAFWTVPRIQRVIDAARKQGVAIEISSSLRLPRRYFLEIAKAAGVKFCFGSNGRYPNMGKLDYSLQMARDLGLTPADLYIPAPRGEQAARRRA